MCDGQKDSHTAHADFPQNVKPVYATRIPFLLWSDLNSTLLLQNVTCNLPLIVNVTWIFVLLMIAAPDMILTRTRRLMLQ